MKIYANNDNQSNILDDFIGTDIWVPVGFDGDIYAWVKITSSFIDERFHHKWYKCYRITEDDLITYHNRLSQGRAVSLNDFITPYAFISYHFDFIDISHVITGDELADEFGAIYNQYIKEVDRVMRGLNQ